MLNLADLIHLPYTPDLTEGGIAYACRWLAGTSEHMRDTPTERLRRKVGSAAVELAFRRYLTGQAIPFKVLGATPFTQPDQYDITLGGHRCKLASSLITRGSQTAQLRKDPGRLLEATALVPLEEFSGEANQPEVLHIFAFLAGWAASSQAELKKALAANQRVDWMHVLPEDWRRPRNWQALEHLVLKSDCEASLKLELGGLDGERDFVNCVVELPGHTRKSVPQEFYSLAYIHCEGLPEKRLGLHSASRAEAYIVSTQGWGNICLQAEEILLAGWLTHAEFHRQGVVLNAGRSTFQFDRTRIMNLMVPVSDLEPIGALLEKARSR
jgi:hypothetical protein